MSKNPIRCYAPDDEPNSGMRIASEDIYREFEGTGEQFARRPAANG